MVHIFGKSLMCDIPHQEMEFLFSFRIFYECTRVASAYAQRQSEIKGLLCE